MGGVQAQPEGNRDERGSGQPPPPPPHHKEKEKASKMQEERRARRRPRPPSSARTNEEGFCPRWRPRAQVSPPGMRSCKPSRASEPREERGAEAPARGPHGHALEGRASLRSQSTKPVAATGQPRPTSLAVWDWAELQKPGGQRLQPGPRRDRARKVPAGGPQGPYADGGGRPRVTGLSLVSATGTEWMVWSTSELRRLPEVTAVIINNRSSYRWLPWGGQGGEGGGGLWDPLCAV